jgi:glycosyltransferase involved in cell wall biosynthesis
VRYRQRKLRLRVSDVRDKPDLVNGLSSANSGRMRIAMVSTPFVSVPPAAYGGTELIVHELAEGLVDEGHDVTLFATGDSRTRGRLNFLYALPQWPPEPLAELNHASWAMSQIAAGGYDLIHAHSALVLGMSRLLGTPPVVYTIHHTRTEDFSDFYRYFPRAQYIAISHRQKELETDLPKCEVIHHGLDPDQFECGAPEDYVCFVARFSEIKGPHTAIMASAKAGVPIRMAGEAHTPDQDFFRRELEPLLAMPHVDYLGLVGPKEKRPLLQKSRALLAPIDWEEPFGLIMVEAMLSGCPVVAFPRGSVPELVEYGVTGFIVSDVNEMADAIRPGGPIDSFDRHRCRTRAIERFSRSRLVADHLRLYRRILNSQPAFAS